MKYSPLYLGEEGNYTDSNSIFSVRPGTSAPSPPKEFGRPSLTGSTSGSSCPTTA
jgi:hypothetical protein